MKNIKNKIAIKCSLVLIGVGLILQVSGQSVSFTAMAPGVVRTGEQIQVVFTLNEKVKEFTPPDFGDFRYLGGPSQGSSTSINIVNGRTTRVSVYTFTYYIQAPDKAGNYTISSASAILKRKTIKSNILKIEVVGSRQSSVKQSDNTTSAGSSADKDIYIQLELDKRTAYVGEQITAWVKLYAHPQVIISGFDQHFKGPEFTSFFRQDVEIPPLTSLDRQKVGDNIYHVGVLRKVIIYPQKSGDIYIEPFDLLVEVQQQTQRRSQYRRKRISLKSKRTKLTIKPLPGNQPDNFSGAVGDFKINASVNIEEVVTNDALTFKIIVSGRGNIKLIDELVSNFPPTFDVFDPIKKIRLDKKTQGKTGKVSFEYTAIPRHAGEYTIQAFSLVYFDTSERKYKTISSQTFSIKVNKGANDSTSLVAGNLSKEAIELLGSDIRYIEKQTRFQKKNHFIFGKLWFYEIYITLFLLFLGILILRREQLKRSVDIARYRNRKAGRIVIKRLRKASKLLQSNDNKAFYEELEKALWGYLADKLNIAVSELSAETVQSMLSSMGFPDELNKEFISIIESCQFARYAPGGMESEMSDLFTRSRTIINKLDQKL